MSDLYNGLISSKVVCATARTDSNLFVRVGANGGSEIVGDLVVGGDLDVAGDIYASTIISAPDISLNPFYIKNENNLGVNPITESAVIIEGGANRVDISDQAVALTLFKPFSSQTIGYQQVGALQFAGVNTAGTTVRYGSIRGVSLNATSNATKGMLEFQVLDGTLHSTRMEIDASTNTIRTDGDSRFSDRGYNLYPGGVKITTAGSIISQTDPELVPESAFTIPTGLDGYYSFTAQVTLGGVGTISDGENFQIFLDLSGGSLTPISGTDNAIDMTENAANTFTHTPGGIIMQRLTAGQTIQLYYKQLGAFTFSSGSIQVAYTYLGDTLLA
jgi:hypothetical protein